MTAQELKNSILQLAVQGKLVPQCKDDEPASEETRQIIERRNQIEKNHIKTLSSISEEEISFEIPESWILLRLGDFCQIYNGNSINANVKQETYSRKCDGYSFIATKDLGFDHVINYDNGIYIPKTEPDFRIAVSGSILLCMEGGSAGKKIGILTRDVCFGNKLCCFTPYIIDSQYLYYYLQSPMFFSDFFGSMTGLIGGVGSAKLKNFLCPIPPLAEQQRIVEKIEELMPLIEEYGKAEEQLSKLNAEFPNKLRKSILQQAVQGKLTERDPADEPASELLKRIKAEKEALIKSGKIKKEKPLPPISDDEKPFDIPDTWEWVIFKDIFLFENGDRSEKYPKDQDLVENGIPFWGAADMIDGVLRYSDSLRFISNEKFLELRSGKLLDGDFVCLLRGDVGKCAKFIASNGFSTGFINAQMIILRPVDSSISSFIELILKSEIFKKQIKEKKTGTAVAQMSAKDLQTFVIPLPPLAEQKRIVKRIEELLALCDELKGE